MKNTPDPRGLATGPSTASVEHDQLADCLLECADEILSIWEARMRSDVPAAEGETSSILRNTFSELITSTAMALAPLRVSEDALRRRLDRTTSQSQTHGGQRAADTRFTLRQVFQEFRLLRTTMIEVMETHLPLPQDARETIYSALESSMLEAGERYALIRQEAETHRAERAEMAVGESQQETESKDRLLATVAHELRTPFSAISNALYVLEQTAVTDERSVRLLESATRQTHKVSRMLDDLLDISRLIRGQMQLHTSTCDLRTIAQGAAETFRLGNDLRERDFTFNATDDPILVEADCSRVEQVIVNLLDNAAKYSRPGGQIDLQVCREGSWAEIRVRDTGIGIEPHRLRQIFGMFEQVQPDNTTAQKGIGLGLSLVKTLVEMHGGTVIASSEGLNQGSEFLVRLPIGSDPAAAEQLARD